MQEVGHLSRLVPCLLVATCLFALGACDHGYVVSAVAPLAAPVDETCLRKALEARNGRGLALKPDTVVDAKGQRSRLYLTDGRASLEQIVWLDLSVTLRTETGRVGRRYTPAETDSIGTILGRFLIATRDECSASGVPGQPPYRISNRRP